MAPDSLLHPRALKARGLRRAVSEDRAVRSTSLPVLKRASVDVYTGDLQLAGLAVFVNILSGALHRIAQLWGWSNLANPTPEDVQHCMLGVHFHASY